MLMRLKTAEPFKIQLLAGESMLLIGLCFGYRAVCGLSAIVDVLGHPVGDLLPIGARDALISFFAFLLMAGAGMGILVTCLVWQTASRQEKNEARGQNDAA